MIEASRTFGSICRICFVVNVFLHPALQEIALLHGTPRCARLYQEKPPLADQNMALRPQTESGGCGLQAASYLATWCSPLVILLRIHWQQIAVRAVTYVTEGTKIAK